MAVGQIQIQGLVQGSPAPQLVFPPYYIPSPTSTPQTQEVNLSIGANTITPYAVTTNSSVFIIPPNYAFPTALSTFGGVLTLKGVTGDTGIIISNTWPTHFTFAPTTATTFVINSTATGTLLVISL